MAEGHFKDLFSNHASDYKRFRPTYPDDVFSFLVRQVKDHDAAWDCGTGNGQAAVNLKAYFDRVYATDPSRKQIEQAERDEKILYSVATAEQCMLPTQSVSLITVFQAFHWFDADLFFQEVKRVSRPHGILAVIGYHTAITGIEEVDQVYQDFSLDYLWNKRCWAMERGRLNNNYQDTVFPFEEIVPPDFCIEMNWSYSDYLSYLKTWSAVKMHTAKYGEDPVDGFVVPKIETVWPDKTSSRCVRFPLVLRVGRVQLLT